MTKHGSCIRLARFSNGNAVVARKCLFATCYRAHGTWRVCVPLASYVVILHFVPCICHERVSLRRPFEYASTPSLFHYSLFRRFYRADRLLWDVCSISIEFPRLISTTLRSEGGGKEKHEERRCANENGICGNFNGWKPNFFSLFLVRFFVPSC